MTINRPFRSAATQVAEVVEARQPGRGNDAALRESVARDLMVASKSARSRAGKIAVACIVIITLTIAGLAYFFALPTTVPHYAVTPGAVVVEMTGPGILEATNKVVVTSRIPGFLKSISVDRNDFVTEGQTLAELDAEDVRSQLEGALADVDAAKSAVIEAQGNRDKAKATLDKANSDLVRRRGLSESGVVSRVEIDALEIAVRQAEAEYLRSGAVEETARARVRAAVAQVGVLQHRLNEARIQSPLNGVVVSRDRSVGDLLTAGNQLFQIVDPKSIVISTRLDESIMGLIRAGQSAKVRFTSEPINVVDARVMRISRTVDPETREFMIDLTLDRLPSNWALGQRAFVAIEVPLPPETLVIPLTLLDRRDGRAGVWRRLQGRAVWSPIEAGAVSGNYLQVLDGLTLGDVILPPRGRYTFEAVAIEESAQ